MELVILLRSMKTVKFILGDKVFMVLLDLMIQANMIDHDKLLSRYQHRESSILLQVQGIHYS